MSVSQTAKTQKMSSVSLRQDKERATALLMALLDKQNTAHIHVTVRSIPTTPASGESRK